MPSNSVYNCSQSNSSGWVQALIFILQGINALRDDFYVHSNCTWIVYIVPVYKASCLLLASRCSCTHVNCEISLTWLFWLFELWISKSGKFLLKLRTDHSGKFAYREINPVYGILFFRLIEVFYCLAFEELHSGVCITSRCISKLLYCANLSKKMINI